jgi:uncharacterized membrane-anchored protein YhcB (DUF1043 family)|nr:MAG TPA: protein of unknown function (DUF5325) [Caudoviricetes sp.]
MSNIVNWVIAGVQLICTIIVGGLGFFLKRELNKAEQAMSEVKDLRTKMAEEYVRKEDYNRDSGEILRRLENIQNMLFEIIKEGGMQ